ncbi:winged helix-turn-helix transcriptional regulator [Sulfitobacter albidus]|uniref:Winged helix-turn-helix transcriptional regulator n=1 Tax=Sulfitobacter albidus TaxID=2829501 RepID=A0A975PL70_9RHOB|nr:MarR family winged helix-turn-helix transcriptional regulator [Sulfitobacter albidus]QUJ75364.1 winged helix-turn-helix transcriptional regulator [Sulfitobacter albidus]
MNKPIEKPAVSEHLTSFLTFRIARTQNKLNAQITHYLKTQSDISLVDWRVLRLLDAMGDTTMSQLARLLQMDKGQLSRKIRGLVERGLITSRVDKIDSRQQILRIDAAGKAMVAATLPVVQHRQRRLVEGISEADLELFLDVLGRIDTASEDREPL